MALLHLGDIPLLTNDDMRASLGVQFTAIQTQRRELNLIVAHGESDESGLALEDFDALQKCVLDSCASGKSSEMRCTIEGRDRNQGDISSWWTPLTRNIWTFGVCVPRCSCRLIECADKSRICRKVRFHNE